MDHQLKTLINQDKVYFECRTCGKSLGPAENLTGECECGGTMVRPYFYQQDILKVQDKASESSYQRLKEMLNKLKEVYETQEGKEFWVEIGSARIQIQNLAEDLLGKIPLEVIKLITSAGKEAKIEVNEFKNFELADNQLIIYYENQKVAFKIDG